ncbi:MAG: hypothetical protein JSW66_05920 [Phycisphaerales bacterium]|nr:MAG: hypothetical protein JSW66_05920 [Phycisphaerales bacterium]
MSNRVSFSPGRLFIIPILSLSVHPLELWAADEWGRGIEELCRLDRFAVFSAAGKNLAFIDRASGVG